MSTPRDFDRYPHGCEIVIPIILKIPIYLEPIVIEKNEVCQRQHQPEKAEFETKAAAAEPAALADKQQAVVNAVGRFSFTRPWKRLTQAIAGVWHSFSRALRNLFETGMSGREKFSQ